MKQISLVGKLLTTMTILAFPMMVFAEPTQGLTGGFETAFSQVFDLVIIIAGIIFVVLFLVGGVMYLTSAGNEEASTKAKKLLIDAVVGLVIVAIAWVTGAYIIDKLGISSDVII
ncbi:MAG: hypothetical protein ACD_58C00318G0001 [uncultured bacterium]|nr:MAG: hypothetical protein ACD_58C00318G0001 [uncultured bacterium]